MTRVGGEAPNFTDNSSMGQEREGGRVFHLPQAGGWGSGPRPLLVGGYRQWPAFGTVSIHKRTIPKVGHWAIGDKSPTVVGD